MNPGNALPSQIGQIALDEPAADSPMPVPGRDIHMQMGGINTLDGPVQSGSKATFDAFS